ncbi:MAG: UDP-2,3-diacylglucosamine diphosphatase [Bacteroidota bacterium]
MKRTLDTLVISDVHLGTVGCHAQELLKYLRTLEVQRIILNGDIFDFWNFRKYYWPAEHMAVIKQLLSMAGSGTQVYYLTGNHDEKLRHLTPMQLGPIQILDKLILRIGDDTCWFFHGDIFDITMRQSKWLAKLGGHGYDLLIIINRLVNKALELTGRERISLSRYLKNSVKKAVQFVDDFEQTAIELAIHEGYDRVFCGHIHKPAIRKHAHDEGTTIYMNSGDWVEHLSALEYDGETWSIYRFEEHTLTEPVQQPYQAHLIGASDQDFHLMLDDMLQRAGIDR